MCERLKELPIENIPLKKSDIYDLKKLDYFLKHKYLRTIKYVFKGFFEKDNQNPESNERLENLFELLDYFFDHFEVYLTRITSMSTKELKQQYSGDSHLNFLLDSLLNKVYN